MDLSDFISKLSPIIFVYNLGKSCYLVSVFSFKTCFQPELTLLLLQLLVPLKKMSVSLTAIIFDLFLLGAVDFQGITLAHSVPEQGNGKNGPVPSSFISIQIHNACAFSFKCTHVRFTSSFKPAVMW